MLNAIAQIAILVVIVVSVYTQNNSSCRKAATQ